MLNAYLLPMMLNYKKTFTVPSNGDVPQRSSGFVFDDISQASLEWYMYSKACEHKTAKGADLEHDIVHVAGSL